MGKISQPTTPTMETPGVTEESPHSSFNVDETQQTSEVSRSQPDELSITNEAIRLIQLKQELGLDAADKDYDHEIKGILELAKVAGIKNKNQLSTRLREIKYKLGVQENKDAVKSIYQYLKIDSQIKSLVNQQEILHANNRN